MLEGRRDRGREGWTESNMDEKKEERRQTEKLETELAGEILRDRNGNWAQVK